MRVLLYGVVALLVLVVLFTFIPTSTSAKDMMAFQRDVTGNQTAATQGQFLALYNAVQEKDEEYIEEYSGTLGEQITQFAIDVAVKYGNGYQITFGEHGHDREFGSRIRYVGGRNSCSLVGCPNPEQYGATEQGYNYWQLAYDNFTRISTSPSSEADHMHFSCHAAASFCWKWFWADSIFYAGGSGLPDWACNYKGPAEDESEGTVSVWVHSIEELREVASPGDIIWNSCTGGCGNHRNGGTLVHSQLWLGDVEVEGNEIKDAYMNCGWCEGYNDWIIRPFSSKLDGPYHHYYVLKLSAAIREVYGEDNPVPVLQEWVGAVDMPPGEQPLDSSDPE